MQPVISPRSADAVKKFVVGCAVVPFEEVFPTAMGIARKIAGNAPLAVQAAKRMMRQGMSESYPQHVDRVRMDNKTTVLPNYFCAD